jgi:hypothetical protein
MKKKKFFCIVSMIALSIGQTSAQQPLVEYSFDKNTDDGEYYPYTLSGTARTVVLTDGNTVVSTGKNKGYVDLSAQMGKSVMAQMTGDYTIALDICVGASNSLGQFCWAWALANGTNQYLGLVNAAGNGNWYYEVKNGNAYQAYSQSGLTADTWHTVVVVQRGQQCKIFIDGIHKGTGTTSIHAADLANAVTQCWLGRSPFVADAYMTNTLMDNFRIYNESLSDEQIMSLYDSRPKTSEVVVADAERIAEMRNEMTAAYAARYIHQSAKLPTTSSLGDVVWTYTETVPGHVSFSNNTFTVVKRETEAVVVGSLQGEVQYKDSTYAVFESPINVTVAPDDNAVGYLYCHMPDLVPQTGLGTLVSQTITFALGKKEDKGLVFNELLGGNPIVKGIGTTLPWCRDAFLAKDKKRSCYYIVTTDLYGSQDGGTSMLGNYSIGMFKSYDLINWTYNRCDIKQFLRQNPVTDIYNNAGTARLAAGKVTRVWAPQIIFIGGDPYIYYAVGNSDNGDCDHFYISKANEDFTSIEDFRMLYGANMVSNILDADINYLETDQLYHMSYRDYEKGDIRDITCPDILHPVWNDEPISTFSERGGFEASSVFRRINEDVWNVGNVNYSGDKGFHFHVADGLLRNLTSEKGMSGNLSPQHGSFVMVSQTEYDLLMIWNDLDGNIRNAKAILAKNADSELQSAVAKAESDLYTMQTEPVSLDALLLTLKEDLETVNSRLSALKSQVTLSPDSISKLLVGAKEITVTNGGFASNTSGWTASPSPGTANGVAEFFAAGYVDYNASIKKEIKGLENGTYLITCQAFERSGYNDGDGRNYRMGGEKLHYHLFANSSQTDVCSMYSLPYSGADHLNSFVNNMSGANTMFSASSDNYLCGVVAEVKNGVLSVGIKRDFTTVHTSSWCCFDNFKVYRLADEVSDIEEVVSAETDLSSESVQIFTLDGVKTDKLHEGINIVRHADGKVTKIAY